MVALIVLSAATLTMMLNKRRGHWHGHDAHQYRADGMRLTQGERSHPQTASHRPRHRPPRKSQQTRQPPPATGTNMVTDTGMSTQPPRRRCGNIP
jgi:hypothetical protein